MAKIGLVDKKEGSCLPLRSLAVEGDIKGCVLGLSIRLVYDNSNAGPAEVVFRMPMEEAYVLVGLSAVIDGRRIKAEVREKEEAKIIYDDAIASGLPTALGEQITKDIFSIALGNLPGGSKAEIELKLIHQLPLDAEKKLSFTLPIILKERYVPSSDQPLSTPAGTSGSLDGVSQFILRLHYASTIASVTSDTHSIDIEDKDDINIITLSDSNLKSDLVIQIASIAPCTPLALIERGKGSPSFMADHVIMVNFLPDLPYKDSLCEFVFLVDRSGSMSGSFIKSASETLILFLKSLPEGCHFNIYGFGSRYIHLFSSSVPYNQETLEKAIEHAQTLKADLGGTEILPPLREIYKQPLITGLSRQIFLLTDGSVSNTSACIEEVKRNVDIAKCFTFGIGSGASSALVEGMAAAGRGSAEFVKGGERLQPKVIRSLKHALQPALTNVTVTFDLSDGVHAHQIPNATPTVYDGERIVMFGLVKSSELKSGSLEGSITLTGLISSETISHTVPCAEETVEGGGASIHHLASKTWLREMERDKKPKEDIVKLSVESSVVCSETAFIAVDEDASTPINEPLTSYNISLRSNIDVQLDGIKLSMMQNIDKAIVRGEKLDEIECASENLSVNAMAFQKSSAKKGGRGFLSGIGSALSSFAGSLSFSSSENKSSSKARVQKEEEEEDEDEEEDEWSEEEEKQENKRDRKRRNSHEKEREERGDTPSPEEALVPPQLPPSSQVNDLSSIILLQQANGSWLLNDTLASFLQSTLAAVQDSCPNECPNMDIWATLLVVTILRNRFASHKDEWELVVKKAEGWLRGKTDKMDTLQEEAKKFL